TDKNAIKIYSRMQANRPELVNTITNGEQACDFVTSGSTLILAADGQIKLIDLKDPKQPQTIKAVPEKYEAEELIVKKYAGCIFLVRLSADPYDPGPSNISCIEIGKEGEFLTRSTAEVRLGKQIDEIKSEGDVFYLAIAGSKANSFS